MDKKQEELKDELKKKREGREIDKKINEAKKAARDFVKELVKREDFKFEFGHRTNLKYDYENNRERFIETLADGLLFNFLHDIPRDEFLIDVSDYCFSCGKWLRYRLTNNAFVSVTFDGKSSFVEDKGECFDVGEFSVEISVPSGKLILVDWPVHGKETIGHLDEEDDGSIESINSAKGRFNRSNKYAKENIMHFFVGNTSPSVYQKDDTMYIGKDGYDDDTDEEIPFVEDANHVGSVCTDLWWVTAFDYEVYKKMVLEKIGEDNELESEYGKKGWGFAQVNVKPGIYKCTHYYETLDNDSYEPQIYSKMEWVREI